MLVFTMFTIPIQRLDAKVPLPVYAHTDDAGFDLYARESYILLPLERVQVKTGIALEIPEGYAGLIWDKSGLSQKFGLKTLGGVVDAGYRGEILVGIVNLGKDPYTIEPYQKIAQMVLQKIESASFTEVLALSPSARGTNGFGSTGK